MGVHGWTRFLFEEGWVPINSCRTSLWRDASSSVNDRVERLAADPSLVIDGNGLVFYLFQIAYARHVQSVTGNNNNKYSSTCQCPSPKNLSPDQIQQLLPTFLPLSVLDEVTFEYISALQRHASSIKVYFDGEARHCVKQQTDRQRQERLADHWDTLRQYCLYGALPLATTGVCEWSKVFPKSRLFSQQVVHTLRYRCQVQIIECDEECDHILAEAVRGDPHAYILGNDSDFCFFPDANYIPFSALDASKKHANAVVIRRATLAESIGLSDAAMIELAILCGNDYLVDPRSAQLDFYSEKIEDCIDYLAAQEPGYRLTSESTEIEHILLFCRTLYDLGNLEHFPLNVIDDEACDTPVLHVETPQRRLVPMKDRARPAIPDDIEFGLSKIDPRSDKSIKDAVLRCLQEYVNGSLVDEETHSGMVTQEHVDVLRALTVQAKRSIPFATWRPAFEDFSASYLIEKTFVMSLELNKDSLLVQFASPSALFDTHLFHLMLHRLRGGPSESPVNGLLPSSEPEIVEGPAEPLSLPIDEHEENILGTIQRNRITIIQGETGCGKSTRIPVMLLKSPPPDQSFRQVKLFISQPRRIAAKALVERLRKVEPHLRDCFALRMGHGVREYESNDTRAWFVTAGYLVRLLANHPERFHDITHVVIDEVHERSVETDLLCLLCRRLLNTNSRIRLVLMSATLAANLYQEYFVVPEPPIRVGARRFPVDEVYLEDISKKFVLPAKMKKNATDILTELNKARCKSAPNMNSMEKIYAIVAHLAMVAASPGSSVLIFVPGMNDIVALTEAIEQIYVPGMRFTCFPIHSDIPFEDQMEVFNKSASDEMRIIIATNAAESSVTLPEVDSVICLGLCKQIVYNELSHRQMLLPTWISKASATQRAGRTGRLRPGTVYRIYSRSNFERDMDEFEPGEMARIPLDSVILMLKQMLADEKVTEVLQDCLEPPNLSTIDRSFESLYRSHFITAPEDECEITTLGSFVSALGIDLALGSLVGLGIQFGLAAETIQMAGVLSFPKTPWIMSNPLIHDPKDYNEMTKKSYVSRCKFDAELFSEPLSIMNLLFEFEQVKDTKKNQWCWNNALAVARMRRLHSSCVNLRRRVADFFDLDHSVLQVKVPPQRMPHSKITALRVIQVWVFHDSVIECRPKNFTKGRSKAGHTLELAKRSHVVTKDDLEQVLCSDRHPFTLTGLVKFEQRGKFEATDGKDVSTSLSLAYLEERFISFAADKKCGFVSFFDKDDLTVIYVSKRLLAENSFSGLLDDLETVCESAVVVASEYLGPQRGIHERACGRWRVAQWDGSLDDISADRSVFRRFMVNSPHGRKIKAKTLQGHITNLHRRLFGFMDSNHSLKALVCEFKPLNKFVMTSVGFGAKVAEADLIDLLAATKLKQEEAKEMTGKQVLLFHDRPKEEKKEEGSYEDADYPTAARPMFHCIPEGARLLSVLASGRRREHLVRLDSSTKDDKKDDPKLLDVYLDPDQTKLSTRWKRMNTDLAVYVSENCVPATALPVDVKETLYAVASNTLEVKGGGLKVEGLTLLPPGRLFLLLARISFGLFQKENFDDGSLEDKCIGWIRRDSDGGITPEKEALWRRHLRLALDFHECSKDVGEELVCFPAMARGLNVVFDGIDGHPAEPWDVEADVFTRDNLALLQHAYKAHEAIDKQSGYPTPSPGYGKNVVKVARDSKNGGRKVKSLAKAAPSAAGRRIDSAPNSDDEEDLAEAMRILSATSHLEGEPEPTHKKKNRKKKGGKGKAQFQARVPNCKEGTTPAVESTEELLHPVVDKSLFALDLSPGEQVADHEMPSTNLLALIVRHVRDGLGMADSAVDWDKDWSVYKLSIEGSNMTLYRAEFVNRGLVYMKPAGSRKKMPGWIKQELERPTKVEDAHQCVPPMFRDGLTLLMVQVTKYGRPLIAFTSIETALRMESAFWLERQFRTKEHWYEQGDVQRMMTELQRVCPRLD